MKSSVMRISIHHAGRLFGAIARNKMPSFPSPPWALIIGGLAACR